ncbi:protein kinase [Achlya hypogyna]|uniref:Protein kinase n=1 Tax=Achlya hypogyna TaxID=1202772 RepID=A0A1V9YEN2_ACHHY|nr:protein kinase [Achlya hypogyna]
MKHFVVQKELATTANGRILVCRDKITKQLVVVKRALTMRRNHVTRRLGGDDIRLEKEVHRVISANAGHVHIVRLLDTFVDEGYVNLVLEYCPRGELYDAVRRSPPTLTRACDYFVQVTSAVAFVHSRGYAHGDISLESIYLDANDQCKLGDFGLAAPLDAQRSVSVGKLFYMAPEMLGAGGYFPGPADVWALGILLFVLLTGSPLCRRAHPADTAYSFFAAHGIEGITRAWKLDDTITPDARGLLSQMLNVDPLHRPTMDAVLAHDYVRQGILAHKASSRLGTPSTPRSYERMWRRLVGFTTALSPTASKPPKTC